MKRGQYCDGCATLSFTEPARPGTPWLACCNDPARPWPGGAERGLRRVVDVSRIGPPFYILRPVWCRRKHKKEPTP